MIKLKCPECGANLELDSAREYAFCQYCGTKIYLVNKTEHTERIIDDAAIKREEIKFEMLKENNKKDAQGIKSAFVMFLISIAMMIVGTILSRA